MLNSINNSPYKSAIVRLENISKIYGSGNAEVRALSEVNLTVEKGEYCSIMGAFWFRKIYGDEHHRLFRSPNIRKLLS